MTPEKLARERSLIVCVGSGGVGKTTTAAALGLGAALAGRRALVLTIDPARRLANALGLKSIGNEECRIELPDAPGELWALMLDTRSTFDDLIRRVSPDDETRERIFGNRVYQVVSDGFASSQEYMATEKLHDLVSSGRYDVVILDTPPVKNALDFLEAPGRLSRFLDRHIMRWFMTPYDESRVFGKVIVGTSGVIFRLLGVIFGREFLGEISSFFLAFRDLYDGFRERHEAVLALFCDSKTAFVVVCAPNEPSIHVAQFFQEELNKRKLPFAGVIVNQVHESTDREVHAEALLGQELLELSSDQPGHVSRSLIARLEAAHRRLRSVVKQEKPFLVAASALVDSSMFLCKVPRLDEPVQDIDGLRRLLGGLSVQEEKSRP